MSVDETPDIGPEDVHGAQPATATLPPGRLGFGLLLIPLGLAAVAWLGWGPKVAREARLAAQSEAREAPLAVLTTPVSAAPTEVALDLPASAQAEETVSVLARATGYVHELQVDFGDTVEEGALLAVVSAPERDEEIRAASVRVKEAERRLKLTSTTTARTETLSATGVVARQEKDDAQLGLTAAQAGLDTARAELRRLQQLRAFQQIHAPFAGTITARPVQPGALVTAGSTVLYTLTQRTPVVVMNVPQIHAAQVQPGQAVVLFARGREVGQGAVSRLAGVLDPATRTMPVEVRLEPGHRVMPGMYLNARLTVARSDQPTLAPARALVVRPEGLAVWAVVGAVGQESVELRALAVLRDLGPAVEVLAGLKPGERVVLSPPDGLVAGRRVSPVVREAAPAPGGKP